MFRRCLVAPLLLAMTAHLVAGAGLPSAINLATADGVPRIDGPAVGAEFGKAALAVGDLDGDSLVDLVIGAPAALGTRGAIYCFFGREGALPTSRNLATVSADLTIVGPGPGSRLGIAAVIADLDGDGAGELVVTTGGYLPPFGRLASGGALIFHGGSALRERPLIDLSVDRASASVVDTSIPVPAGASLTVGDFNLDRFDDIAIGSPASPGPNGELRAGRVFAVFGGETFPNGDVIDAASGDGRVHVVAGSAEGDEAGTELAAGDLDGDGRDDLLIGMPSSTVIRAVSFEKAGTIAVVSGDRLSTLSTLDLAPQASILLLGSDYGDYLGLCVSAADVTGDGRLDIVASAIDGDGERNARYPDCGEVFTIESNSGSGAQRVVDLMERPEWMRVIGDAPKRFLGSALGTGDLDGDRRAEVIASSKSEPGPNGSDAGAVFVLHGNMSTVDLAATSAASTIYGPSPNAVFGTVVCVADLNGDGVRDVVGTAPGALGGRGGVYVIAGVRTTPDTAPVLDAVADITLGPGQTAVVPVTAHDSEGDPMRLSISGRPSGASFVDGGDGTASLTIGSLNPETGEQHVRVTASDGQLSSLISFRVLFVASPPPIISKAVYKNSALRITGENFTAGSIVSVNGHMISAPVSWNPAKGRLRITASMATLGLLPQPGANSVVVTVDGVSSAAFSF